VSGIAFDRAADYYDETRRLPSDISERLAGLLADELEGRQPCLEIGVGTGRIALPLHAKGIELVGIDLARPMLDRLVVNAGGRSPFPLVHGDVTRLPCVSASMGSVLASHLLHLIPEWQRAVDEAMVVLRPGGALLVDFGGGSTAPWNRPAVEIFRRKGIPRVRSGVSSAESVSDHLGPAVAVRPLPPLSFGVRRTLALDLSEWEGQTQSWTWSYTSEQMIDACADIRRWATETAWALDREVELERTVQWWVFERPG
jgi:ubiquinone/menaquinone biosynthesis C-methylase UbiE